MVENKPETNADHPPSPADYADFSEPQENFFVKTLVQFIAIPLLIVSVAIAIYVAGSFAFGTTPESTADYVSLLRGETINRRWQAAAELAGRLGRSKEIPAEFRDPELIEALNNALTTARRADEKPPRHAITVLAILGRLQAPASLPVLRDALDDKHPWIRSHALLALGRMRDRESRPRFHALAASDDPGTRQAALFALSEADKVEGMPFRPSPMTREVVERHLGDAKEDVRFTAALVAAEAGDREQALPVLVRMLDRTYLEQFELDKELTGIDRYKVHSNVIRKAIRAVVLLKAKTPEVLSALGKRADDDAEGDSEIRELARAALREL